MSKAMIVHAGTDLLDVEIARDYLARAMDTEQVKDVRGKAEPDRRGRNGRGGWLWDRHIMRMWQPG